MKPRQIIEARPEEDQRKLNVDDIEEVARKIGW